MQNFDFVPKACETATERAHREREQREQIRQQNAAAIRIQAFVRGHKVVEVEQDVQRRIFDETTSTMFPHDDDKLALRTGTFAGALPPAGAIFGLVRSLNFFICTKRSDDCRRMELLSSLIAASVMSSSAPNNYCFLAIPIAGDNMAVQWVYQTSRLLARVFEFVEVCSQHGATDEGSRKQARNTAALLFRMVLSLTDHKQWGFARPRGKRKGDLSPQEEGLLAFLSQKGSETCVALLQRTQGAMYGALRSFVLACTAPEAAPPDREDVVAAAVLTLAVRPVILAPAGDSCPAAAKTSPSTSPLPLLVKFLDVPFLCRRVPSTAIQLLHHRTVWERLAPHLAATVPLSTANWDTRYVFGNVIQIGMAALTPIMASDLPQDEALSARWLLCVQRLLSSLPPAAVVRAALDEEGHLEHQISALWATSTTQPLFHRLFADTEHCGDLTRAAASAARQPPAAAKDWKDALKGAKLASLFKKKPNRLTAPQGALPVTAAKGPAVFSAPQWVGACRLYDELLTTWPSQPPLAALCFRRPYLVVALWRWLCAEDHQSAVEEFVEGAASLPADAEVAFTAVFTLFCRLYHNFLLITDGEEFFREQNPFPLPAVAHIADVLNRLAFRLLATTETTRHGASAEDQQRWFRLRDEACATVLQLVDRDTRHAFVPAGRWVLHGTALWQRLLPRVGSDDTTLVNLLDSVNDFSNVVRHLPHTIPFALRVKLFRQKVEEERRRYHVEDRRWQVSIRRPHLVEDGLRAFMAVPTGDARLKAKLFVMFQNAQGLPEAGIDAGGVFKEFVTHCLRQVFDPTFGLFTTTTDDHIYPNPASGKLHANHLQLFQFIGRVAGKALFEGIVANVPLADFFLNFLLQKPNSVDDLVSQDPELFRNLMYLKSPQCDVPALSLTFCVEEELLGQRLKRDLQPHGSEVDVTADNLIFYIHAMADYKLNQRIAAQTRAFLTGYYEVIKPEWLRMFDRRELSHLISGEARDFDVEDLRLHTQYAGGYDAGHRVIKAFWAVLREMTAEQRSSFLQFVTSCPKPPLLGFANLHPPMCIRCYDQADAPTGSAGALRVLGLKDTDRLPSASTCFNLLKLPPYRTQRQLREKLLYAISAGSGFELS